MPRVAVVVAVPFRRLRRVSLSTATGLGYWSDAATFYCSPLPAQPALEVRACGRKQGGKGVEAKGAEAKKGGKTSNTQVFTTDQPQTALPR